jgi:integrase
MATLARKFTDATVRNAKPKEKPYKLAAGAGLYVEVSPAGGRHWRLKYRWQGKEKRLTFGPYPAVSVAEAQELARAAKKQLAHGIDPAAFKAAKKAAQAERSANSLEIIAREWWMARAAVWVPGHADRILRRFERDVFPTLGARAIADLDAPTILTVLRKIEDRGAIETAHRALTDIGQVCRYAIATGRLNSDPARDLRGALRPTQEKHHAAITDAAALGTLLRAIEGYQGSPIVRGALRMAPHVFVRPGELRHARWVDLDLEGGEWRFTLAKTRQAHLVPLSEQVVAILRELQPLTGKTDFVFPGARSPRRPMSDNAVLVALRSLGFDKETMTGHGFRAAARTILDEVLGWRVDLIEHQLGHTVKDALGRAYNRTSHLPERRKMMQAWSTYLEGLQAGPQGLVRKRAEG